MKAASAGDNAPVKAASAGEGAQEKAPAIGGAARQESAAASKARSTRQPKAQPDPATTIETTAPAPTSGPTEITTETTETVDLRAPDLPEPDTASITVRPATDGATPAEADRTHRPPTRSGGVVSPTRAPNHGPAGTRPASTGPAATRPPARPTEDARPVGARTVETADSPTTQARRRRTMLLVFVVVAIVVVGVSLFVRQHRATPPTVVPAGSQLPPVPPTGTAPTGAAPTAKGAPPADAATTGPSTVSGKFTYVNGYGPLMGTSGTLRRFRVAVESTIGQGNGGDVADEIDSTLGDPRSWIAGRDVRLQRVPQQVNAEFTIYLASARTSERMCAEGGLVTKGYTSCRLPGQVILNEDRWEDAVPGYGAPIATYRAYAINHEVGHELGHSHEACPGSGRLAPVLQQQTYGLNGCVANAWPYIDGRRYSGPPAS